MNISVIIPTYRPQSYIWECLDSLCQQTLDKECFEIIIVLNGEKEPWYEDIQDYIAKQNHHIVLLHTKQPGVSNARNMALDVARGEYITFVDDDDYLSPSYLEELLSVASPTNIALSNSIAIDESLSPIESVYEQAYRRLSQQGNMPFQRARKFFSGPWMKLIHRDMIGSRRFDIQFKNGEDALFMFLISDRFQTVSFTSPKAIYYRRMRSNGAHAMSISQTWCNAMRLMRAYSSIYWTHTREYSFRFYFTRLLGAIHQIIDSLVK